MVLDHRLQWASRASDRCTAGTHVEHDAAGEIWNGDVEGTQTNLGMKNRVVVGSIHQGNAIPEIARDKILRFNRRLEATDGVAVCFASDHDPASLVRNAPGDIRVGSD